MSCDLALMVIDSDPQQQMHRYESSVMDFLPKFWPPLNFTVQLSVDPAIGHPETRRLIHACYARPTSAAYSVSGQVRNLQELELIVSPQTNYFDIAVSMICIR
jgi:hypothetical protein